MNHQDGADKSAPGLKSDPAITAKNVASVQSDTKIPAGQGDVVTTEPGNPKVLTADEQMALFEKDLKENDWGHQPC